MSKRCTVLLADDHEIVLEGLRRVLEADFEVVGAVKNGIELTAAAKSLEPDVIVIDISMPRMNGMEAARQIQKDAANAKIVFLSMHPESIYVSEAFRAGASAYVLKSSAGAEIVNAIYAVLQGETYITAAIDKRDLRADIPQHGYSEHDDSDHHKSDDELRMLSPRLRAVLQMTAEGKNTKAIAHLLQISPRTVEFHRYRAMDTLGLHSIAQVVQFAVKHHLIKL